MFSYTFKLHTKTLAINVLIDGLDRKYVKFILICLQFCHILKPYPMSLFRTLLYKYICIYVYVCVGLRKVMNLRQI